MSIMSGDEIPDELKPFRPHLSARFFEMRERVLDFVFSVVQPAKERYARELKTNEQAAVAQGLHPLKAREPAVLSELRQAAKERGLYNFFLPTVCGLSVLEYAPIAEILGIFRLANQVGDSLQTLLPVFTVVDDAECGSAEFLNFLALSLTPILL